MVIANSLWELNIAVVRVIIKIFGLHGPFSIVSMLRITGGYAVGGIFFGTPNDGAPIPISLPYYSHKKPLFPYGKLLGIGFSSLGVPINSTS
jgi:hypothetical protein